MQYRGVIVCVLLVACGGGKKQGEIGGDCYPNGTCNVTLSCLAGLCVAEVADAAVDDFDAPRDSATDGSSDAAVDARLDAPRDAPPDAYCEPAQTDTANLPDGHHNAGMACMTAGCHLIGNAGAGAPEYSFAGTLYRDTAGTQPYAGATVIVTVGGTTHKIVTSATGNAGTGAGNFFIAKALATPPSAAMPGTTSVSACPTTTAMAENLVDNGGNCNNCHRTGGTTLPLYLQ